MMHMTKSNTVTPVKSCHNFPWFYWSHAPFSPTTGAAKTPPVWAGNDNPASQRAAGTPHLSIISWSSNYSLPSARISPQRVLIRLKSILPPSYTPLFPQQNPHPSPLVLKYSNALSTEYSRWLIWTIVFLLPVLSSNFVFSHSTSSDAWALQVWTLRQKQILYSDTQIFAGCTFPAIQPSICKQYVQIRCSKFMLLWSHMGKVQHCQLMYTVSYHNMNCKQLEGIVQLTASGQEVQTEKRLLLNANTE